MPQTTWNIDIFQFESPWLGVNLGVDHDALSATAPCPAGDFEAAFKRSVIAQHRGVGGLQYFQEQRSQTQRNTPRGKWLSEIKTGAQQPWRFLTQREHPPIKPKESVVLGKIGDGR